MAKDYKLLKVFKKRWEKIRIFEEDETRKLSVAQKFHQIAGIISIGIGLRADFDRDKGEPKVRSRWISLKKGI